MVANIPSIQYSNTFNSDEEQGISSVQESIFLNIPDNHISTLSISKNIRYIYILAGRNTAKTQKDHLMEIDCPSTAPTPRSKKYRNC